jgi:epoxyqueuosine reductase QueG
MDKNKNYLSLKRFCKGLGIDIFGVADISGVKKDFLLSAGSIKKFDKAICLGLRISAAVLEEIETHPTKLYFHHYRALNAALDQAALRLTNFIQDKGFLALPIPASVILDWENQKAHLSHKKIGQLAGLGWIGRNNLLVNKTAGSQFRIVSILTNMPLKLDKPLKDFCGNCRQCILACPAQAIKDNPSDFDHLKCFEKLKDFQKQKLVDQYICGICVKVCKGDRK